MSSGINCFFCNWSCRVILALVLSASGQAWGEDCIRAIEYLNEGVRLSDGSEQEERYYRDAMAMCDVLSEGYFNLGVLKLKRKDFIEAQRFFDHALQRKESVDGFVAKGVAALGAGEFNVAVSAFKKAQTLTGEDDVRAAQGLVVALFQLGEVGEAANIQTELVERAENSAVLHFNAGVIFERLGKVNEAVEMYKKAFALDSSYFKAVERLSLLLQSIGKLDDAIFELESARNVAKPELEILLAYLYSISGDFVAALEELDKIEDTTLTDEQLVPFGMVLVASGSIASGIELLQAATENLTTNSLAHGALGWALLKDNQYAEAEIALRRAIDLNKSNATAHNNLGVLYEIEGSTVAALREYKSALRCDGDLKEAKDNIERLTK